LELIRTWRNRYHNSFFSGEEITKEQHRSWYGRYKENNLDRFWIIVTKSGEKCGTVSLYNISLPDRTAELGRALLLEEYRGCGYAEEAVNLVCEYAFKKMNLHKIKVACFLDNIDAIAVYSRARFKTTTRPIILLERVNEDHNPKKPISYDDLSADGYESQCSNLGD
jgi:RimJ/RimL family protein N-acetyltransferase